MTAPRIRSAKIEDIPTIQSLARKIWVDHYPGIITQRQINYMLDADYSAEALERAFSDGVAIDLMSIDGNDGGFAAYGAADSVSESGATPAKLHKLYLDTSFHGRGLGSMLLQAVMKTCREQGYRTLELQVNKHNLKAIKAYERGGFRRKASILKPIGDGFFMDDFVMEVGL